MAPAVSVSVSVAETSSSKSKYESAMKCLEAASSSICKNLGLGKVASAASLGRRQLQGARRATKPVCEHGGSGVTCSDDLKNGNELMADCGGGCKNDEAKCAVAAARTVAVLQVHTNPVPIGSFEVYVPHNLTRPKWPSGQTSVTVRTNQRLSIACVPAISTCDWPTDFRAIGRAQNSPPARMQLGGLRVQDCGQAELIGGSSTSLRKNRQERGAGAVLLVGNSVLVAKRTKFLNNTAQYGGAIRATGGKVNIVAGHLSGNHASQSGGALHVTTSTVSVTRVSFSKNTAGRHGAAIYVSSSVVTIVGATFVGNAANSRGGAIYATSSPATWLSVTECMFEANHARDGGAIFLGEGDFASGGQLIVTASMFVKNIATGRGGSIYVMEGSATLRDVTFTDSQKTAITMASFTTLTASNITEARNVPWAFTCGSASHHPFANHSKIRELVC